MAPIVHVFIDYQNVHLTGHGSWCQQAEARHLCLVDPLLLATLLVARRGPGGELKAVHVFRGRPDPRREPKAAARSDHQASAWEADPRVHVFRRQLRYPRGWGEPGNAGRAQEKGVDVQLAVHLVEAAINREFKVGIVFSHDTDLIPALESASRLGAHIEIASRGGRNRLRSPVVKLFSHTLTQDDFEQVRDQRVYE